jgi:uncharacterized glyoxalase superfamily protein PhnB
MVSRMPKFAALGVIVTDIEHAAAFYRKLGFDFADPADPDGHGHAEAVTTGGLRFMLDTTKTIESFDKSWTRPTGGHMIGIALECASPAEVDEVYERMVSEGAGSHAAPWDAFWGQRYAQITDPDGHVVDLFAQL